MSTHDELNGRLALAHAGIADDHYALAVDVQQNTVAGDAGGQLLAEILHGESNEVRGLFRGPQQGAAMVPGTLQAFRQTLHVPGQDQGRNGVGKQVVKHLGPPGLAHLHDIRHFRLAHDLDPAGIKVIEQSQNLQIRAVEVHHLNAVRVIGVAPVQNLQAEVLHIFCQAGALFTHHVHPFSSVCRRRPHARVSGQKMLLFLQVLLYMICQRMTILPPEVLASSRPSPGRPAKASTEQKSLNLFGSGF